jgi:hypothetical protein
VVAIEIARLRTKERENKTIFTSEQSQSFARGIFRDPACALPDIFLKDSPKETPDANETSGALLNMAAWSHILN